MVYRGKVHGGVVVIEGGIVLAEGTEVTVTQAVQVQTSARAIGACADHVAEKVDRLLGWGHRTTDEGAEEQQRVDRVL
jgi:hypothetical protein